MFGEIILAAWTCAGLAWWMISYALIALDQQKREPIPSAVPKRTLSIFKPLPPLGADGLLNFQYGLESFVKQLEAGSEMLLGIHEMDREETAPFLREMRTKYPAAVIHTFYRSTPDEVANPKIAWQKILATQASGELWLWSDADIIAPPGFLDAVRAEFGRGGEAMMTYPYVVRELRSAPALLEALYVNVDFYPGVLLLRRSGPVDFGLGAAMLFHRDDFIRRVDWNEIGEALADDFFLGQRLGPVRIGEMTLETVVASTTWPDALAHDFRWAKTIRWNRPLGSFSRIVVLPLFGWLAAVALHPANSFTWLGLVGMIQADVLFAMAICRLVDCNGISRHVVALEAWSLWRPILWLLAWTPWPIKWSGREWHGPRMEFKSNEEASVGSH